MIAHAPSRPETQGLRLDEIAARWGKDPVECVFDIFKPRREAGRPVICSRRRAA
jgi:N-acyl-D-aspartate/D-glutamate deacylase